MYLQETSIQYHALGSISSKAHLSIGLPNALKNSGPENTAIKDIGKISQINEALASSDTAPAQNTMSSTRGTTDPVQEKAQKAWSDILQPVGSAFQDTASEFAKDVTSLFGPNQNLSTRDLL